MTMQNEAVSDDDARTSRGVVPLKLIDNTTELIACKKREIQLLEDMLKMYLISYHFNVPIKQIDKPIYRIPTREDYDLWPKYAKDRLGFDRGGWRTYASSSQPCCEVYNAVKLRDGTVVNGEPLFITHPELRFWASRRAATELFEQQKEDKKING